MRGAEQARLRRTLPGGLLFLAGLCLGLALARPPAEPQARPVAPRAVSLRVLQGSAVDSQRDAQRDAQRVRGLDSSEAETQDSLATRFVPAVPAPIPAEPAPLPEVSEIAKSALAVTVYLTGTGAYGAGILLDREGHVLTCHHVIEGLDAIKVSLANGSELDAVVLDSDAELDLALLKVASTEAPAIRFGSVTSLETGDELFAMGAPRKMKFSLTRGMASFVGRAFDGVYYVQTDIALNGGSSGGPVLDRQGRLVAISSFVFRNSEGLSFALPIDYAYERFDRFLADPPAPEGATVNAFESWLSTLDEAHAGANDG